MPARVTVRSSRGCQCIKNYQESPDQKRVSKQFPSRSDPEEIPAELPQVCGKEILFFRQPLKNIVLNWITPTTGRPQSPWPASIAVIGKPIFRARLVRWGELGHLAWLPRSMFRPYHPLQVSLSRRVKVVFGLSIGQTVRPHGFLPTAQTL